ncbi:hypothetical protein X777_14495 [Ooceraea biroi]|uniref:Uncharacterized protein n=1 Tax=Ooceraea biroi TaxID=2015173 RepID=A0A026VYI7_OOCBI|nr:hypothetical protein X777_14495 [Ooceraea biroi]
MTTHGCVKHRSTTRAKVYVTRTMACTQGRIGIINSSRCTRLSILCYVLPSFLSSHPSRVCIPSPRAIYLAGYVYVYE